jgi:hypothetical protein
MKSCSVLARTVWFVAVGLSVGRPVFPRAICASAPDATTDLAGAIITNAYISLDKVSRHAERVATHRAGRRVCQLRIPCLQQI